MLNSTHLDEFEPRKNIIRDKLLDIFAKINEKDLFANKKEVSEERYSSCTDHNNWNQHDNWGKSDTWDNWEKFDNYN